MTNKQKIKQGKVHGCQKVRSYENGADTDWKKTFALVVNNLREYIPERSIRGNSNVSEMWLMLVSRA